MPPFDDPIPSGPLVDRRHRVLLALIVVLGAAIRLFLYLPRPSLSIDESMLGLEIGARSFRGLLQPLDYAQTGPPLFLWMIRLSTLAGGMNEYALRALPLVAGGILPLLVWRVGRKLGSRPGALLAAALTAFSPTLIHYSVVVKPYVTDAVIATVLLELALAVRDEPDRPRVWAQLGLAGLVAVVMTAPAPLMLGGVVVGLLSTDGVRKSPATLRRLPLWVACWGVSFAVLYTQLYRPVASSWYMQQFWAASFLTPGRAGLAGRALAHSLVDRTMPIIAIILVVALVAVGFRVLWRRHGWPVAALLGVPVGSLLVASALLRYPLSARLLEFMAPPLIICIATALEAAIAWHKKPGWVLAGLAIASFVLVVVSHPPRTPATRQVVTEVMRRAMPDEAVYVASGIIPAWVFYTTDWSAPDTAYLGQVARWASPGGVAFHNSASRGHGVDGNEGSDLLVHRNGRREVLGIATGIQWREVTGLATTAPDPGWARHEAARIRAAATPAVWIVVTTSYTSSPVPLLAAIEAVGGRREAEILADGCKAYWYGFTSASN